MTTKTKIINILIIIKSISLDNFFNKYYEFDVY